MSPIARPLVWLIQAYRYAVSPRLGQHCKYYPSCSEYAIQAIRRYGILRGVVLAAWRVLRCNPWSRGGFDPVDEQRLFTPRPPSSATS